MLCFVQHDDEDQHSDRLVSTFYNDVFSLNLDTLAWNPVLLGKALQADEIESSDDEDEDEDEDEGEDEDEDEDCDGEANGTEGADEGAQSVEPEPESTAETLSATSAKQSSAAGFEGESAPSPRIGAGMIALHGEGDTPALLVFGGMHENAKGGEEPSNDLWRFTISGDGGGWERLC
jgi:hypothetical protein